MYYEVYETANGWKWKIYHYENEGKKEVIDHKSYFAFDDEVAAMDNCAMYMDHNNIDAELA